MRITAPRCVFIFMVAALAYSVTAALVTSTKLSQVSTGIGNHLWRVYHPSFFQAHLAWPAFVGAGAISTGDGFQPPLGKNGESCVAVGRVTRTAGLLYASLIGSSPRRLKGQRDELPRDRFYINQSIMGF